MRQHESRFRNGSPISTVKVWRYGALLAGEDAMPLHGSCTAPLYREVTGAESTALARLRNWRDNPDLDFAPGHGFIGDLEGSPPRTDTAYIKVRCRKCEECLTHRMKQWTARAIAESRVSRRTWFLTLTFAPEARFKSKVWAQQTVERRRAERWEHLTPEERYKALADQTGKEVTLFLKRLRKKARFRYLLVSEAHRDGFPHYHALIHEDVDRVSKRDVQASWRLGFSQAKLLDVADGKACYYVCKYLAKDAATRVRASQHYGDVRSRLTESLGGIINSFLKNSPRG